MLFRSIPSLQSVPILTSELALLAIRNTIFGMAGGACDTNRVGRRSLAPDVLEAVVKRRAVDERHEKRQGYESFLGSLSLFAFDVGTFLLLTAVRG